MTILVAVYIDNPKHLNDGRLFASKFHPYTIRTLLVTTNDNKPAQDFQFLDSFQSAVNVLIKNHITLVFSDTLVDNNRDEIVFGHIDFPKQVMYCLGNKYKFSEFEDMIVHIIRERSNSTMGIKFNNEPFVFCSDKPPRNFGFTLPSPFHLFLYDAYPNVHLSWPFTSSEVMVQKWKHLTENIPLVSDQSSNPQVYVVANSSNVVPPMNTVYFCMEPQGERLYKPYIDKLLSQPSNLLFLGTHDRHLNNAEWHLSSTLGELKRMKSVSKKYDRVLSVCVTSKNFDPGHKYRLALIHYMDKRKDLPFALHIYGRCQSQNFVNYKGELPDQEKDSALFDYKYHLNVENQYIPNYITEKLYDTMCAETLLFYFGCPNWQDFFEPDSLVQLSGRHDLLEEDVKLITRTIMNDEWTLRLPAIRRSKQRILYEYSFEPRLLSILQIVKTQCYVGTDTVASELLKEGFKSVHNTNGTLRFVETLNKCLSERTPMMVFSGSDVPRLFFDRLCFAVARDTSCEVVQFGPGDDASNCFFMPLGQEKALRNLMSKRPLLDGLKVSKLGL